MSSVATHPWGSSSDATSLHLSWHLPLPCTPSDCVSSLSTLQLTSSCLCSTVTVTYLRITYLSYLFCTLNKCSAGHRHWSNIFWMKEMWGGGERGWDWGIVMVTLVRNFNLWKQNREVLKVNMIRDDKMTALNKAEWISALEYCHLYIQTD